MDTDYDPEESESETGTPKKGRKKEETPDPGLTVGTDIEDHLKPDGKQVEIKLSKVRIVQEKTKGQIRRKDAKLLQKRIESLEAAPPTRPIHVVLWEDTVCSQRTFRCSRCASPRAWTCLLFAFYGDCWCVSGQHSVEAVLKIRDKHRASCLDSYKQHTTCTADILKPDTPWAFGAKLAGQAQGSAQDVEPIPRYEAADNLLPCVEDQRRRNIPDTYNNLKIAIVDAVQMRALVPTAELKQPGQFVCSFNGVSTLLVARGLAHDFVIFSIIRINCGKIS